MFPFFLLLSSPARWTPPAVSTHYTTAEGTKAFPRFVAAQPTDTRPGDVVFTYHYREPWL